MQIELKEAVSYIGVLGGFVAVALTGKFVLGRFSRDLEIVKRDIGEVKAECSKKPHCSEVWIEGKIDKSGKFLEKSLCQELRYIKGLVEEIKEQRKISKRYGEYYGAILHKIAGKLDISIENPPGV